MLKFFVFVCLCAYAFAEGYLEAVFPTCSYHIKFESARDSSYSGHYYGLYTVSGVKFARIEYDYGFNITLRCDDRNENGYCYARLEDPNGDPTCEDDYVYMRNSDLYPPKPTSYIYYDEEQYPMPADCPDSTMTGCQKYCSTYYSEECVIVDSNGYFVQDEDHSNYTYYDDLTMDVFAGTKCDGQTSFSAPVNFCETLKEYKVPEINCSYHYKIEYSDGASMDVNAVEDLFGSLMYVKSVQTGNIDQTAIGRCDDRDEYNRCYIRITSADECTESYQYAFGYFDRPNTYAYYDSAYYPQPSNCLEGSAGCFKYCEDEKEFECIVVDSVGRIVNSSSENEYTTYKYFDPPSMDEFDVSKCDGVAFPKAIDFCSVTSIFTPKLPDCTFNVTVSRDNKQRMNKFSRGNDSPYTSHNLYGVLVNGKPIMIKVTLPPLYELIRCDLTNGKGTCFIQHTFDGSCKEMYHTPEESFSEIVQFFLPSTFIYDNAAYPKVKKCPDSNDDCNEYCDFEENHCVLVDSTGFVLTDSYGTNWTYYDELSMDVFETDTCKTPSTHIPAPTTDYCAVPSSSTPTPPGPTPTPTPSPSNPALSSASVVKSVFTFVAIALALALL